MNTVQESSNIQDLITTLQSPEGFIRQEARTQLVEIGFPAVPALLEALQQFTGWGRWEVAKALSEIQAPQSAPILVAVLEDENSSIRWLAVNGLIGIGRAALPPLLEALTQRAGSICLRESAHHVLHGMRDNGLLRKPELEVYRALRDSAPDVEVPWAAEEALKELAKKKVE
jgi:HEAT repeat protein